jgi:endonuclease V-like protein UPF0215 family
MGKKLENVLDKESIAMANKQMKIYSKLLVMKEMPTTTIMINYMSIIIEKAKSINNIKLTRVLNVRTNPADNYQI